MTREDATNHFDGPIDIGGIGVSIVLLKDLANEFGLDRSNMRRYAIKNGFEPLKVRTSGSRGQLTLALSLEDAEAIRQLRQSQGYTTRERVGKPIRDNGIGWFYIIQLVPELEAGRVKLGFTKDINSRMNAHKTVAPTAKLLWGKSCNRNWELAAIASITREGCHPLSDEVFIADNLDTLIKRSEEFFAILPSLLHLAPEC